MSHTAIVPVMPWSVPVGSTVLMFFALFLGGCSPAKSKAPPPPPAAAQPEHCFTAVGDGANPAQAVFDRLGRSGNGETWHAIIFNDIKKRCILGAQTTVPAMQIGWQFLATCSGRPTWIGFDTEAGGALFCTGDAHLFQDVQAMHKKAKADPTVLEKLIRAVPANEWDD